MRLAENKVAWTFWQTYIKAVCAKRRIKLPDYVLQEIEQAYFSGALVALEALPKDVQAQTSVADIRTAISEWMKARKYFSPEEAG